MNFLAKSIKTILWGNSIALAWTWGIGMFFSVQMAIQFGLRGLLIYSAINAIGLAMFGIINAYLARKQTAAELEAKFFSVANKFKFALLFYQVLAVTLTLFTILKYVTLPLGVLSILVGVTFIGATIFIGEEFSIGKLKYIHLIYSIAIAASFWALLKSELFVTDFVWNLSLPEPLQRGLIRLHPPVFEYAFWVPILLGFAFGPWLDLQHWQRVIQIKKEKLPVATSYALGGLIFFSIIVIDGIIALAAYNYFPAVLGLNKFNATLATQSTLLLQAKDIITQVLNVHPQLKILLSFYVTFVALGAISTFDSGYVALKWYLNNLLRDTKSLIFTFVPKAAVSSPIPWFMACTVLATITMHFSELGKIAMRFDPKLEKFFRFELEYYMGFFAVFFIMYAVTFIRSVVDKEHEKNFSGLRLFATGLCSTSVFGIGYFSENTVIMALASLIPLIYGIYTVSKDLDIVTQLTGGDDSSSEPSVVSSIAHKAELLPNYNYQLPAGASPVSVPGCYMQDGWFVHSFIPTYQDTNSVGNVYFAMYAMWVGKTRELFFLHTMPGFDPKTSEFLILTRNFEHKFIRETQEFVPVTIHIRIADYNRKFVTMEHKIYNSSGELLGKGKQSLMFVSSKDYSLIDIPSEVYTAYLPYAPVSG